jgi:hypothetical protein
MGEEIPVGCRSSSSLLAVCIFGFAVSEERNGSGPSDLDGMSEGWPHAATGACSRIPSSSSAAPKEARPSTRFLRRHATTINAPLASKARLVGSGATAAKAVSPMIWWPSVVGCTVSQKR